MHRIYDFLTGLNPDLLIAAVIAALFTVEQFFSRTKPLTIRGPHLMTNALLQLGYILLNYGLAWGVVKCFDWIALHKIGLFNQVPVSDYIKIPAGILCVDLVNYWTHRLDHRVELLWRLHRVHHSDTNPDSSTAYRFHPFDAILDNLAGILAVLVFGLDAGSVIGWLILYIPVLVLHHAQFEMPAWFDKTIGQILVSPNIHKIHHHQEQEYTDSNYGLLFIFWDKIFGTYRKLPLSRISYGLKEFEDDGKQKPGFLLRSPFVNLKK